MPDTVEGITVAAFMVGLAEIVIGVFVVLEAVPRLAGGSADLVFALSLAAVAPLVAALILQREAPLPRP